MPRDNTTLSPDATGGWAETKGAEAPLSADSPASPAAGFSASHPSPVTPLPTPQQHTNTTPPTPGIFKFTKPVPQTTNLPSYAGTTTTVPSFNSSDPIIANTLNTIATGNDHMKSNLVTEGGLKNKVIAILGSTCSGKTTLLNYLAGKDLVKVERAYQDRLDVEEPLPNTHIAHNRQIGTSEAIPHSPLGGDFTYFDLPGYGYVTTESPDEAVTQEIAGAYFRHKVADAAQELKVILVISCNTILGRQDNRNALFESFERFTKFLKTNSEAHLTNVLLVVSGVHHTKSEAELERLKNAIAFQLNLVGGLKPEYQAVIPHLKAHIALFFDYSTDESAQLARERDIILSRLAEVNYLPRTHYEPAIDVSDITKNIVTGMAKEVNSNIAILSAQLSKITDNYLQWLIDWYQENNITDSPQMAELIDRMSSLNFTISELALHSESALHSADQRAFAELAAKLDSTIPGINNVLHALFTQLNQLQFCMNAVPKLELEYKLSDWADRVHTTISAKTSECHNALEWALFAEELTTKVKDKIADETTYDTLKEYLHNLSQITVTQLTKEALINSLIELVGDFTHVPAHESPWGRQAIVTAKQEIIHLVHCHSDFTIQGEVVTITGYMVSAEDALKYFTGPYTISPTALRIFALNTVFLDADLVDDRLKGVDVCIIAPYWKVVTTGDAKRVIDISGQDGEAHVPPKAADGAPPAENGDGRGNPGSDGLPGNPGSNGGNFIGIAISVSHSDKLQINVSGGNGGPGQDGGDGSNGRNGQDATKTEIETLAEKYLVSREEVTFKQKQGFWSRTEHSAFKTFTYNTRHTEKYKAPGALGSSGGDAGRGGSGGINANPGVLELLCIEPVAFDPPAAANGNTELHGSPGSAGSGGKNGQHYQGTYLAERILPGLRGYKEEEGTGGVMASARYMGPIFMHTAMSAGQMSTNETLKEAVKVAVQETVKTTVRSVITSTGIVALQAAVSLGSAYFSSGWTAIGISDEDTGSAPDGETHTDLNIVGLRYPDEPSPTLTREQCWADYTKFVEDTGLLAQDSPYIDPFTH